jgi:hypothetical protein
MKITKIFFFTIIITITMLSITLVESKLQMQCGTSEKYCRDTETCCKMKKDDYGCCPYKDATCCDDYENCCPNGYQCDLSRMKCVRQGDYSFTELMFLDVLDDQSKIAKLN